MSSDPIRPQSGSCVLDPVFALVDGAIIGHLARSRQVHGDAVIDRGICDLPAVFAAFAQSRLKGRLFVPLAVDGRDVVALGDGLVRLPEGLLAEDLVVLLDLHDEPAEATAPGELIAKLRRAGHATGLLAHDGASSSLMRWLGRPDYVVVGPALTQAIQNDAARFQVLRTMYQLADLLGIRLLATNLSRDTSLRMLRDLGVGLVSGYNLMEDAAGASGWVARMLAGTVSAWQPVQPERARSSVALACLGQLAVRIRPVAPDETALAISERFASEPQCAAIPVVKDGAVMGLVTRERISKAAAESAWVDAKGCEPCSVLMEPEPILLNAQTSVHDAVLLIAEGDRRHVMEGLIVTDRGKYLGLCSTQQLMRDLIQYQRQATSYANAVTGLPGEVPIIESIQSRLDQGVAFVACCIDIDHFKSYNDVFGYLRGDNVIKYVGILLSAYTEEHVDFLGHLGGGQFIMLWRTVDWRARCELILQQFDASRAAFVRDADLADDGYTIVDRRGLPVHQKLLGLSIGAVAIEAYHFTSHHQVLDATLIAKREAKKIPGSALFVERRQPRTH